jgi:hypothetical protein
VLARRYPWCSVAVGHPVSPRIKAQHGEDWMRLPDPNSLWQLSPRTDHGHKRINNIESALDSAAYRLSVATSQVDGMSAKGVEAFLQTFPQGGVGVDVAGQLRGGQIPQLSRSQFGQKLADLCSNEVGAE